MQDTNRIYIRIENIDYDSFKISNKASVMAFAGSRKHFRKHPYKFNVSETAPQHVWSFRYDDVSKTSFVLVLYKYRILGADEEIGQVEINLKGFKPNTVTTHEFNLFCPEKNISPKVTISIHINQDGSEPFTAPQCNNIPNNAVMKKTPLFNQNRAIVCNKSLYI